MITIELQKPQQLSDNFMNPVSGFVSFNYNAQVVAFLKALPNRKYIAKGKRWEVPYRDITKCAEGLSAFDDVQIIGEYFEEQKVEAILPEGFTFKTKPYPHQIDTLLFGLQYDSFLLGDDQGAGKTKQIIDLFRLLKFQGKVKRCLVICCVNGNKYNWEKEVELHSDCKPWVLGSRYTKNGKRYIGSARERLDDLEKIPDDVEFIITNVETLRLLSYRNGNSTVYPIAERLRELCLQGEFGITAIDEVHKNKNPDSQQSKAAMRIQDNHRIPMSGTFVLNAPFDFYFALKWAGYEDHSWWQFQHFYAEYAGYELIRYKNLDVLRETVEPIMLRRMKTDILDLPEKIRVTEYVEMDKKQQSIYNAVRNDILGKIDKIRLSNNPLSQLIRLRQATGYPGILSSDIKNSAKMDRMQELVDDEILRGGKVLIFSEWAKIVERVQELLAAYKPAVITGDVKQETRFAIIDSFQNHQTDVCIGTTGSLGTGFTLSEATLVIFMDEPWNRALKDQAEDRAHRIGTHRPVTVVTLLSKGTIDERVNEIVERKGRMADFLVDGKLNARSALNTLLDI